MELLTVSFCVLYACFQEILCSLLHALLNDTQMCTFT